jgi:hypothetical protein
VPLKIVLSRPYSTETLAALFVTCRQDGFLVIGALKMKRSLSLVFQLLVKLGTCLAACIGCSSKTPPTPSQPRTIHWKGQDSGYEDTTALRPIDRASNPDTK